MLKICKEIDFNVLPNTEYPRKQKESVDKTVYPPREGVDLQGRSRDRPETDMDESPSPKKC